MVGLQFLLHFESVGSSYCGIHIIKTHGGYNVLVIAGILIDLFSKGKILPQLQKVSTASN